MIINNDLNNVYRDTHQLFMKGYNFLNFSLS